MPKELEIKGRICQNGENYWKENILMYLGMKEQHTSKIAITIYNLESFSKI